MKDLLPWSRRKDEKGLTENKDWLNKLWLKPFTKDFLSREFIDQFPKVDISETGKEVSVKAELPGMSEKDINLSYLDGVLHIKGEKKEEKQEEKKGFFHRESYYGSFARSIPLGNHLDWDKVEASFKKGELSISIPKKEDAGNKIKININ